MLLAMQQDLAAVPNITLTIVCCEPAAAQLPLMAGVQCIRIRAGSPAAVGHALLEASASGDHVIPIAPECDGILSGIVRLLRQAGRQVIAPADRWVDVCSDKWKTWQLLQTHGLPTVPTFLPAHTMAFRRGSPEALVVKPRDGAGGSGISRMTPDQWANKAADPTMSADSFVVQPWIGGNSWSIAMLGQGLHQPPLILPLTEQHVFWEHDQPRYKGGRILAGPSAKLASAAAALCHGVAAAIQLTEGYVGIDLLQPKCSEQLLVCEINPRLCTSYIGYRKATKCNLSARLMFPDPATAPVWVSHSVRFDV